MLFRFLQSLWFLPYTTYRSPFECAPSVFVCSFVHVFFLVNKFSQKIENIPSQFSSVANCFLRHKDAGWSCNCKKVRSCSQSPQTVSQQKHNLGKCRPESQFESNCLLCSCKHLILGGTFMFKTTCLVCLDQASCFLVKRIEHILVWRSFRSRLVLGCDICSFRFHHKHPKAKKRTPRLSKGKENQS